jgi:hypothetical protein
MQWERINEMRLVTWNVCTLYRAGAMNEMVKKMERNCGKKELYDFI